MWREVVFLVVYMKTSQRTETAGTSTSSPCSSLEKLTGRNENGEDMVDVLVLVLEIPRSLLSLPIYPLPLQRAGRLRSALCAVRSALFRSHVLRDRHSDNSKLRQPLLDEKHIYYIKCKVHGVIISVPYVKRNSLVKTW